MAKNIDFYIASKITEASIISAANTVSQNDSSRVIHPDTIKMLVNGCTNSINEFVGNYIDDYAKIIEKTNNKLQKTNEFKGSEGELFGRTLGEFVANKSMGNDIILINDWDQKLETAVNNCVQAGNLDYDSESRSFMIIFKDNHNSAPIA